MIPFNDYTYINLSQIFWIVFFKFQILLHKMNQKLWSDSFVCNYSCMYLFLHVFSLKLSWVLFSHFITCFILFFRILVGAPLGQNPQPNTTQTGTLKRCPITQKQMDCEDVITDGRYSEWWLFCVLFNRAVFIFVCKLKLWNFELKLWKKRENSGWADCRSTINFVIDFVKIFLNLMYSRLK